MKRIWIAVLLAACLGLTGCGQSAPETAADGQSWDEDWVTIGNVLGVDTPDGLTLRDNSDALEAKGMYYAAWSAGVAASFVDGDGETLTVYDGQVSLLLAGYDTTQKAADSAGEWLAMALERYRVEETWEEERNGQSFTLLTCAYPSETGPYAQGAAAFGVYGNYALSVELSCQEDFDGSPLEILRTFLDNCHYAA